MTWRNGTEDQPGAILVTGCSSGIGREAVRQLTRRGYDVVAACRKDDQCERLRSGGIRAVRMDNDQPESIETGWREAMQLAPQKRIRAVFANAGYGLPGAVEDLTWEALEAQFRTNVLGTHALIRLAVEHMRARGGGRIIIGSSTMGIVGAQYLGAFVASQFALEGMADVLRLELRGTNIRVAILQAGPVLTRFRANSRQAFERHIEPEDSAHRDAYARLRRDLMKLGAAGPFTALPEECVGMLVHAIESKRPRPRYRWTPQATAWTVMKRLLPTWMLDEVVARVRSGATG